MAHRDPVADLDEVRKMRGDVKGRAVVVPCIVRQQPQVHLLDDPRRGGLEVIQKNIRHLRLLQMQPDTFRLKMLVYCSSNLVIHRSHHLISHFHNRHLNPILVQVLRHLQTNKPSPHDQRPFHVILLDILLHPIRIIHVT